MSDKSEVRKWHRRLDEAEALRKQFEPDWEDNYKAVYGPDWMKDGKRSEDTTSSKSKRYRFDLLLSYLKTEIPSLILYRPEIFLTATEAIMKANPNAEAEAKTYESEVNKILNDMDGFEYEVKSCLADAHCAWGIVKVLNDKDWQPNPKAGNPVVVDGITTDQIEPGEMLNDVKFSSIRVDPFKFLIDSRCKNDPNRARWKGEEIDRTFEELTQSGLYSSDVLEKLRDKLKDKSKDDWEIEVKIFEIYDRVDKKLIVLCREMEDEFLRYDDMPEGIESDPYIEIKFCEIPGQVFPKPEISTGRQIQEDQREGRVWFRDLAKRSVPKLAIKPSVDEQEQSKLEDGISQSVRLNSPGDVWVVNNDLKVGTAPKEHLDIGMRDFDQIMGQSSQDRGLTGGAKFATEAQIAEQQGKVREGDKLNTVKVWLSSMIEKLIQQVKFGGYAELAGLNIDVDLDIEIDIESKSPKNKAIERKQLTEALTIIGGNPIFIQSPTLLDQILRDYDIRERGKIITELQQAMQAQQQAAQPVQDKKGLNLSLSLKHELLPPEAIDKIVDLIMNEDIPINQGVMPQQQIGGNGRQRMPDFNESVGAGTEGMGPGSGLMPQGSMV